MNEPVFNTPQEEISYLRQVIADLNEELYSFRRPIFVENRITEIVDILFPRYYSTTVKENKPPVYPKKDWWWNGASPLFDTLDYVVDKNGIDNVVITVKSYVAGGNYDEVEIKFPTSFIDLPENEFKETVSNWLLNEIKVYNEAQKAKKELEAKQQIAFLQAELDRLKSA